MKIGILTLPPIANYGGILQAYALQKVLRQMGHQPETWRRAYRKETPLRRLTDALKVWVRKTFHYCDEDLRITQYTHRFIQKHLKRRGIVSFADIRPSDYGAIIVGSDQIWRNVFFRPTWGQHEDIADAFLAFTDGWNIKRIAYAPSFGRDDVSEYSPEQIEACGRALRQFDAVSVREQSGVDICKKAFGVNAQWVIDPTMLLPVEDYKRLIPQGEGPRSKFLMKYVLDDSEEKNAMCEMLAKQRGAEVRQSNGKFDDFSLPLEERIQPPVESWLRNFRDASFVFTDSFHACVFSILFHKQFAVVGNKGRGLSRFESLLGLFGLENRMVETPQDCQSLQEIDYTRVDAILERERAKSLRFLKEVLAPGEN